MMIDLDPKLEAALNDVARQQGLTPEALALSVLRERFLGPTAVPEPQDEWERRLLAMAKDCGVSLPNSALSREELYD
jgi:hypothetical protein